MCWCLACVCVFRVVVLCCVLLWLLCFVFALCACVSFRSVPFRVVQCCLWCVLVCSVCVVCCVCVVLLRFVSFGLVVAFVRALCFVVVVWCSSFIVFALLCSVCVVVCLCVVVWLLFCMCG